MILGIVPRMRRRIAGRVLQKTARARALAFVRMCAWVCAGAWTLPSMRADVRVSWRVLVLGRSGPTWAALAPGVGLLLSAAACGA